MIRLSIKSKLQIMLVVASLGSILVVGYLSWSKARSILTERIFEQLTSVRASKAYQVESYLNLLRHQIETLGENRMVVEAMTEFDREFDRLKTSSPPEWQQKVETYYNREFIPRLAKNIDGDPVYETYRPISPQSLYLQYQYIANNPHPVGEKDKLDKANDGSGYSEVHQHYHKLFRNLIQRFGYYDLFLIDPDTGEIVYSVYKETDYATSLNTGPYNNSNLAKIVEEVEDNPDRGAIQLIDFKFYRPSYNAPAAFIAAPIYDGNKRVGILAVQLPVDEIDKILTENQNWKQDGLGDTGETYLVGEDLYLRSISRPLLEEPKNYLKILRQNGVKEGTVRLIDRLKTPVLLHKIRTIAAEEATQGKKGTEIIKGYGETKVLSSYAPLNIEGVNWGIISEISLSEAYEPIDSLQNFLLLTVVVLMLLMTLFATLAAQRFTRPIETMVKQLRNLDGNDVSDLEINSQDELSELAEILNAIAKKTRVLTNAIAKQDREQKKLIANIMPVPIAERWQNQEQVCDRAQVTIIAIRIEGLEQAQQPTTEVAKAFSELVTALDNKGNDTDIERLNCFGESYIAVCGLTKPRLDRIKRGVDFANDALNLVKTINRKYNLSLNLRIGIDTGVVTAAIVGESKFRYDLWGEPVNVATQLAQQAEANTILVTEAISTNVKEVYDFEPDNSITLMDKRSIPTWVFGKTGMSDLVSDITSGLNLDFD